MNGDEAPVDLGRRRGCALDEPIAVACHLKRRTRGDRDCAIVDERASAGADVEDSAGAVASSVPLFEISPSSPMNPAPSMMTSFVRVLAEPPRI